MIIRWSAAAITGGVAATAGWVSYGHALAVVRLAGAAGPAAFAYPVFTDGVVYISGMVLLSASRRRQPAPALAWWALGIGIALTLAANVASMAKHGTLGMAVGALPAVALVLSYELCMYLIRVGQVRRQPTRQVRQAPEVQSAEVRATAARRPAAGMAHAPQHNGHDACVAAFRRYIEVGQVPGIRVIKRELSVGQAKATEVQGKIRAVLGR